jgi:uncharacterized protein (DUF433 family)
MLTNRKSPEQIYGITRGPLPTRSFARPESVSVLHGWLEFVGSKLPRPEKARLEDWLGRRLRRAEIVLQESVARDAKTRRGTLVIRGTRFPVARVFAEISDDRRLSEIAEDFDLDINMLRQLVEGMAIVFERPVAE